MNDPLVLKFSNEKLRPLMLQIVRLHKQVRDALLYYEAWGLEAKLSGDTTFSDFLEDGSPADGRPPITAGGVRLAVENLRAFLTQLEGVDPKHPSRRLSFVQGAYSMAPFVPE